MGKKSTPQAEVQPIVQTFPLINAQDAADILTVMNVADIKVSSAERVTELKAKLREIIAKS